MAIRPKQYIGKGYQQFNDFPPTTVAIGVQAPQNTAFIINNGSDKIFLGKTGIYELNLQGGLGTISSFNWVEESMEADSSWQIDILYDDSNSRE